MNTVVVGCKLPNGLILEMGKVGADNFRRVRLNGANSRGALLGPGGYGLTQVDKDFMEAWMKKHGWLPAVKNRHVFMQENAASAQAAALDNAANRTGMEPLDPKKPPEGIKVDEDHLKASRRDLEQAGVMLPGADA